MDNEAPLPRAYTHPADIALVEFGYDPSQVAGFLKKTPAQRLAWLDGWSRWVGEVRARGR